MSIKAPIKLFVVLVLVGLISLGVVPVARKQISKLVGFASKATPLEVDVELDDHDRPARISTYYRKIPEGKLLHGKDIKYDWRLRTKETRVYVHGELVEFTSESLLEDNGRRR